MVRTVFVSFGSCLVLLNLYIFIRHRCCPKSVKKAGHKYSKNILNSLLIIIKKFKNDDNHKLTNESSSSSYHTDYSVTMVSSILKLEYVVSNFRNYD